MDYKLFTFPGSWFTLKLPVHWQEYDDGEEDTFSFFNSVEWSGNLRITPFRWENVSNKNEDKAINLIENELKDNEGAQKIRFDNLECAYYKKYVEQDGKEMAIYYWIAGKNNTVFICSFTTNREQEEGIHHKNELLVVENILKNIRLN